MKKVILDENLPRPLRHHFPDFDVVTVQYQGWSGIQNGDLIQLIDGNFDVFITADKNLRYQQNLKGRVISIIEIPLLHRSSIPLYVDKIRDAILASSPGSYIQIQP